MNTPEKPAVPLGKFARARGGKELVKFKDVIGNPCVLETMNIAFGNGSLRLGLEKAQPKIQALDARALGIGTSQKTGLIKYEVPPEVRIDVSVVLSRNQVADLVSLLTHWIAHGTLESNGVTPAPDLTLYQLREVKKTAADQVKARQILEDAVEVDELKGLKPNQTTAAAIGESDEELAREDAAEFALNAQLDDDGIPPELREPYQVRRRKGEIYKPRPKTAE